MLFSQNPRTKQKNKPVKSYNVKYKNRVKLLLGTYCYKQDSVRQHTKQIGSIPVTMLKNIYTSYEIIKTVMYPSIPEALDCLFVWAFYPF